MKDNACGKSEELCELLPWYVNRTLNDAESRAMDQHLRRCATCAEELPILRAAMESMHVESVAVLAPKPNAEQFLANARPRKLWPHRQKVAWVAGAVAASIALFVAVFTWTRINDSEMTPAVFQTVTNSGSAAMFDYVLLISFDLGVDPVARDEALHALAPVSAAGPDSVGAYRVVIRLPAKSMDELDEFTQSIKSNSVISDANVVAIELPVESR